MNKDRIDGVAKQAKGSLKEATGNLIGDAKMVADGKAEQIAGKIQNAAGSAKEIIKDSIKTVLKD